jgi:hypothetical protein
MRTWKCLPILATRFASGYWNVRMQTDVALDVSANRRHYDRGGLVKPSSRISGPPPSRSKQLKFLSKYYLFSAVLFEFQPYFYQASQCIFVIIKHVTICNTCLGNARNFDLHPIKYTQLRIYFQVLNYLCQKRELLRFADS